jgi:hypothetical protein
MSKTLAEDPRAIVEKELQAEKARADQEKARADALSLELSELKRKRPQPPNPLSAHLKASKARVEQLTEMMRKENTRDKWPRVTPPSQSGKYYRVTFQVQEALKYFYALGVPVSHLAKGFQMSETTAREYVTGSMSVSEEEEEAAAVKCETKHPAGDRDSKSDTTAGDKNAPRRRQRDAGTS